MDKIAKNIDKILKKELDSHFTSGKHRWQIACYIKKYILDCKPKEQPVEENLLGYSESERHKNTSNEALKEWEDNLEKGKK